MTEDVRPLCIFCHQRFTYGPTPAGPDFLERRQSTTPCEDPRSTWGHVEFWGSTKEQRDARFGPPAVKPEAAPPAPEPERTPQMGFGL